MSNRALFRSKKRDNAEMPSTMADNDSGDEYEVFEADEIIGEIQLYNDEIQELPATITDENALEDLSTNLR